MAKEEPRPALTGQLIPGVSVALLAALAAWGASRLIPNASALLIAIVAGMAWRNLSVVPASLAGGTSFAGRQLLRAGIVLLGLQLSLGSILALGPGLLLVVLLSVGVTFFMTLWMGKLLGVSFAQRLLIASGFSVCGAAAVAATEGVVKAKEEEVATAIALVVLYGTLMIGLIPFLGHLLSMPEEQIGMWIGASTHEVAQVVAAGSTVGPEALAVAVTVKLARVLTLAPITTGISVHARRSQGNEAPTLPPVVPTFVVGFILAMLLRSSGIVPEAVLAAAQFIQTILLAAAMFSLGLGVHIRSLLRAGRNPALLGLASTSIITALSLTGALAFGP